MPAIKQWAEDPRQRWARLDFNQFGRHATLAVKTIKSLYHKTGGDRLLAIVLVRDLGGCVECVQLFARLCVVLRHSV